MSCPNCNTSENHVTSDKEYVWYCHKCTRYELRPLPEEMPLTPALKKVVSAAPKREKWKPTVVRCVDCGTEFTTMNRSRGINRTKRCPECQVAYNKARERRYYESYQRKDRKIKKLGTTADADSRSGVKALLNPMKEVCDNT